MSHDRRAPSPSPEAPIPLVLSPRRVTLWLAGGVAVLSLASLASRLIVIRVGEARLSELHLLNVLNLLNVDADISIPSWFSVLGLFAAAVLLAWVAAGRRALGGRSWIGWAALSVIFAGLSLDESVGFHSLATGPMGRLLGTTGAEAGLLAYTWVVAGTVVVGMVAAVYVPFLLRLPVATRRGLILAGAVYVGGAIVVESVTGLVAYSGGDTRLPYALLVTLEEAAEMGGVVILLHTLLRYLGGHVGALELRVAAAEAAAPARAAGRARGGPYPEGRLPEASWPSSRSRHSATS